MSKEKLAKMARKITPKEHRDINTMDIILKSPPKDPRKRYKHERNYRKMVM